MKSHITAIRAVTAEFAQQFIRPLTWIAFGVILALLLVVGLLTYFVSMWWLLLLLPITLLILAGIIIWLAARITLRTLSPRLNVQQRNATEKFVAKLQFAVETVQTPYPVIVFYIIRDILLRKDAGFISQVTLQSKTLRPEFEELRKLF